MRLGFARKKKDGQKACYRVAMSVVMMDSHWVVMMVALSVVSWDCEKADSMVAKMVEKMVVLLDKSKVHMMVE